MKNASQLIIENAAEIIEASKNIPSRHFLYMDENGNIGTCEQNQTPIGTYNILTSRPVASVNNMVDRYQELESNM